jgi:hypothetical protein
VPSLCPVNFKATLGLDTYKFQNENLTSNTCKFQKPDVKPPSKSGCMSLEGSVVVGNLARQSKGYCRGQSKDCGTLDKMHLIN